MVGGDLAAIGEAGLQATTGLAFDHRHLGTLTGQIEGGGYADNTGADDDDRGGRRVLGH